MTIVPGETVALVGETGAGKCTVMKLLIHFDDPQHGSVRVDGTELRSLDLSGFRRLGYVPQEAFLFTGSIRDNIAYGRPDASDATVEAAARAMGAHDFIATLDGGYRHELSERGRSLSAGQRQLIALARAELVNPAILLLDEATSNLDLAAEAKGSAAMHRLSQGRTTVVIAPPAADGPVGRRDCGAGPWADRGDWPAHRTTGPRWQLRCDVAGFRRAGRNPSGAAAASWHPLGAPAGAAPTRLSQRKADRSPGDGPAFLCAGLLRWRLAAQPDRRCTGQQPALERDAGD